VGLHKAVAAGQGAFFDLFRFRAFFTTSTLNTVNADKAHRQHAVIENLDPRYESVGAGALSIRRFHGHTALFVLAFIAFNLTRAGETLASPTLGKAVTATVRRELINLAARVFTSAHRITLRLPEHWLREEGWTKLFTSACSPPGRTATQPPSPKMRNQELQRNTRGAEARPSTVPETHKPTNPIKPKSQFHQRSTGGFRFSPLALH